MLTHIIVRMSDEDLIAATIRAAANEKRATAELLTFLAELDRRRICFGLGCASLFTFCTRILRLSEHAAYHRIEAARAIRQFPSILPLVADGSLTLTNVALLRGVLTDENLEAVLTAATHKSKNEVLQLVASLAPKSEPAAMIRRLPHSGDARAAEPLGQGEALLAPAESKPAPTNSEPTMASKSPTSPRPMLEPVSADRFLLRVTLSASTHAKLRRAQDLIGPTAHNGDLAEILDRALSLLVDELERVKFAKVRRPRPTPQESVPSQAPSPSASGSRHIPAAIRRQVWARDGGRCAFVGPLGRCTENEATGVSSRATVRPRRTDDHCEPCTSVSRPQCIRERTSV